MPQSGHALAWLEDRERGTQRQRDHPDVEFENDHEHHHHGERNDGRHLVGGQRPNTLPDGHLA